MTSKAKVQIQDLIPSCDTCHDSFLSGRAILTSASCGHSFHATDDCVEALDISQKFDRVEVYSGGCRVNDCKYDGKTVLNSSEASPTTLLFRNLPLESLIAKVVASQDQLKTRSQSKRTVKDDGIDIPSTRLAKRVKLGHIATIPEDTEETPDSKGNLHDGKSRYAPSNISDIDTEVGAPLSNSQPTEESDPEEEERDLAKLIQASQTLQRMPYETAPVGDETIESNTSIEEDSIMERNSANPVSDDEPPPPDPYGMPPLSQWRKSTMA